MSIRVVFIIITLIFCCTACSEKNQLTLEQQSLIRWYEDENEFEIYAMMANNTKNDISFEASFVFTDEGLKDAIGIESDPLETDDRNNTTPFKLNTSKETLFLHKYKANSKLTREMLTKGTSIKIITPERSYTIAIKHVEKM